jgi:hypothetical protein
VVQGLVRPTVVLAVGLFVSGQAGAGDPHGGRHRPLVDAAGQPIPAQGLDAAGVQRQEGDVG